MRHTIYDNINLAIKANCTDCCHRFGAVTTLTLSYDESANTSGWIWFQIGVLHLRATAVCNMQYHCSFCTACCSITLEFWDNWHWRSPGSCGGFKDFNWSVTRYESDLLSADCR